MRWAHIPVVPVAKGVAHTNTATMSVSAVRTFSAITAPKTKRTYAKGAMQI